METMIKTVSQVVPMIALRRPNVLFVSDDAGERAWLAAELARRVSALHASFDAAGFENRKWEGRFTTALHEAGLELPEEPLGRALDVAFSQLRYDFVVVLSDSGRIGLGDSFCKYMDALFASESELLCWEVPTLGFVTDAQQDWAVSFLEVQGCISAEVSWLLACLEDALPGAA